MYSYRRMSGQGLRWDVFSETRRICIAITEDDAKLIVAALNSQLKGGAA